MRLSPEDIAQCLEMELAAPSAATRFVDQDTGRMNLSAIVERILELSAMDIEEQVMEQPLPAIYDIRTKRPSLDSNPGDTPSGVSFAPTRKHSNGKH